MPAASLMISAESLWANCGNNTRQEGVVRLWANRRPPGGNRGAQLPRWLIIFQPGFRLAVQKPASEKRHCDKTVIFPCSKRVNSNQNASEQLVCKRLRNQVK